MNSLEFNNKVSLADNLWIEFEYNIAESELIDPKKSGHRMMIATALNWAETGRENRAHNFEINLYKTERRGFYKI